MRTEELRLTAPDGKEIFVHHWAPEPDVPLKGAVQIAHGMAEHGARYAPVADVLTRAGYVVWANDHRGHGHTIASPDEQGFFGERDGWALVLGDVHLLNRHIAKAHEGLPLCLLGHSMGSFMAQDYMATHPDALDAVVLSGSTIGGGALVSAGRVAARLERLRQGPRGRSALLESLSFGAYNKAFKPNRTAFDWLSRDEAVVDAYVADPLCGFRCTNQLWVDFLDALSALGRPGAFENIPKDLPIYVIAGARDPVSSATKGLVALLAAYERAGLRRVSHRFWPGARHEIFNDTNRGEVLADLVAWLDENLAAQAEAA